MHGPSLENCKLLRVEMTGLSFHQSPYAHITTVRYGAAALQRLPAVNLQHAALAHMRLPAHGHCREGRLATLGCRYPLPGSGQR